MIMDPNPLLEIRNLRTEFLTIEGRGLAVDDVEAFMRTEVRPWLLLANLVVVRRLQPFLSSG